MDLIKRVSRLLGRYWPLIILLILSLITYGQLVKMNFWQDDNALVFKFTHINEDAGYLGKGIFGSGPYRYTVTPYYPIFKLFGYNPVPYFVFCLFFYILSVYAVYFFFRVLFENRKKALVAGLIYASGYIASDGFIRLFNSVLASLSVILVTLTLGFYFKYSKIRNIKWYLLSLLGYLAAIEFGYIRTHYLILVIVAFEFIYLFIRKYLGIKQIIKSAALMLLRLAPFLLLFDKWFIGADLRLKQVGLFIQSLIKGNFYVTYSFFTTLGNMLLSNEFFPKIAYIPSKLLNYPLTELRICAFFILVCLVGFYICWRKRIISTWLAVISGIFSAVVLLFSRSVFSNPGLIGGLTEKISLDTGIAFILIALPIMMLLPKKKDHFWLFFWVIINLGAYATYIPIFAYPSDNRYLLHSLIPLAGLFSSLAFVIYEKIHSSTIVRYVPFLLIVSFIGINVYSSLSSQKTIIEHRSLPSKRFFKELMSYYTFFPKGSLLYFYVPQDKPFAQEHYDAGFDVAQMPEETAIAWRYGIDRYDLKIVNNYDDLEKYAKENMTPVSKIFAFIADPDQLINETDKTRDLLTKANAEVKSINVNSEVKSVKIGGITTVENIPINIGVSDVSILTPVKVTLNLAGYPLGVNQNDFPFEMGGQQYSISDESVRNNYLNYREWEKYYYQNVSIAATSEWRNLLVNNIIDNDPDTYWEADRILWDNHDQGFTVDLKKSVNVGAIIYKNGPSSLIPTFFDILVSQDGTNFTKIKTVNADLAKKDEYQKIVFPPSPARFVKVAFHKTLYDDAPGIAEFEVLPYEFRDIDYYTALNFFRTPFSFVSSIDEWQNLMDNFRNSGLMSISWKTDESDTLKSAVGSTFPIIYDGKERNYSFIIPAGGQFLRDLITTPITIPGKIFISSISFENLRISI